MVRHWLGVIAWSAAVVFSSGCGGGYSPENGVVVTGKITKKGAAYSPPQSANGMAIALVALTPVAEPSQAGPGQTQPGSVRSASSCKVAADSSFKIVGAGRGVAPGKYSLRWLENTGASGPPGGGPPGSPPGAGPTGGGQIIKEVVIPAEKLGGVFDLGEVDVEAK